MISNLERWLPRGQIDIFGQDRLMFSSIPYYTLNVVAIVALFLSPENINNFPILLYLGLMYSIFPMLDEIFSLDNRNPSK